MAKSKGAPGGVSGRPGVCPVSLPAVPAEALPEESVMGRLDDCSVEPSEGTQRCDRSNIQREVLRLPEVEGGHASTRLFAGETLLSQDKTSKHTFHFSYFDAGHRNAYTRLEDTLEGR